MFSKFGLLLARERLVSLVNVCVAAFVCVKVNKTDTQTPSTFVQARAKIKPEGFEAMLNGFVSETNNNNAKYLHKGYRIFVVEGSDSHVPDNPDAYFPNPNGRPLIFTVTWISTLRSTHLIRSPISSAAELSKDRLLRKARG